MALPSKVVEQLGRAPVRTPGWSGRVLMFSATFLIISLATFIGIRYGVRPFTQSRIGAVNQRIEEFGRKIPLDQQLEIASLYSQLVNLKTLLDQQTSQVDFLRWLERNTNTNVQINELTVDAKKKTLQLSGSARTLANLAEQLNLYRSSVGFIDRVELGGVNPPATGDGPWGFQISLTLNRDFYKKIIAPVVTPVATEENDDSSIEEEALDEELNQIDS
ncbi:MAG: hypothetical protein KGZ30_02715 [Anaplasmataceae bacterium]|nr:hypothetical protein [Anaplasmataceae bacterium]